MKRLLGLILLVASTLSFGNDTETTKTLTITGKLMPSSGLPLPMDMESFSMRAVRDVDLASAEVTIYKAIEDVTGKSSFELLAKGNFVDGEITLNESIENTLDLKISVDIGFEEPITLELPAGPSSTVSFALVDASPYRSQLHLLGASRRVKDSKNKFSISGDMNFLDIDVEKALVTIETSEYDKLGHQVSIKFGSVLLEDGKFLIEAEVTEPRPVSILFGTEGEWAAIKAIVQPRASLTLTFRSSWIKDLVVVSGTGKHSELFESWQQSEEYLSTAREYRIAYQEFHDNKNTDGDTNNSRSEDGENLESETPKYQELLSELKRIRIGFWNDVALHAEDPMDALLAVELGALSRSEKRLAVYDRLSNSLDTDLVARRVTHARNMHAKTLAREGNDKSLTVGKTVSDFTLPNLDGDKFSLFELLEENDFVLLDFWASWCGPCIESFPALKDLYSSYKEHGFEIVSVSIDETHELWSEGSKDHDLPWINLGEAKGWTGEIATAYGVNFIPKGYLVDKERKIVQKDVSPEKLKTFLIEEYGEKESLEEPKDSL